MNIHNRKTEYPDAKVPFRTDRLFCVNGDWYFAIRRGSDQGPYQTREDAEHALKLFIEDQQSLEKHRRAERDVMRRFGQGYRSLASLRAGGAR